VNATAGDLIWVNTVAAWNRSLCTDGLAVTQALGHINEQATRILAIAVAMALLLPACSGGDANKDKKADATATEDSGGSAKGDLGPPQANRSRPR
jgi:hypothetical protein